jgi:hypothetical protein
MQRVNKSKLLEYCCRASIILPWRELSGVVIQAGGLKFIILIGCYYRQYIHFR